MDLDFDGAREAFLARAEEAILIHGSWARFLETLTVAETDEVIREMDAIMTPDEKERYYKKCPHHKLTLEQEAIWDYLVAKEKGKVY